MNKSIKIKKAVSLAVFILCLFMLSFVMSQESPIEDFFRNLSDWDTFSVPQPDSENLGESAIEVSRQSGITYECSKTPVSLTRTPLQIVTFDPNINSLYVGSLLEGEGYLEGVGSFRELPIRQRAPLTISISLLTGNNTKTIENPSKASVEQAIGELIQIAANEGVQNSSKISYRNTVVHSLEQAAVDLGFSARYMSGSVKVDFNFSTSVDKTTVMVHFVENMFTVSMELPQTPGALFSDAFTNDLLQDQVNRGRLGPDNLPVYIANVTYGRIMTYSLTSSKSATEIKAALDTAYNTGALDLSGSVASEYQKLISESETQLVTVGGDSAAARRAIQTGNINEFFSEATALQTATPISYTIHNVSDSSLAKVAETTDYTRTECTAKTVADYWAEADEVLEQTNGGRWGTWADSSMESCGQGNFAVGYQQKIENENVGDDTALNAIRLLCGESGSKKITSTEGPWGTYGPELKCDAGHALVGFNLKVEPPQSGDDTAANSIRMVCRDLTQASGQSTTLLPNDDGITGGKWGSWADEYVYAPDNHAICGIETKVEGRRGNGDDTALNDVRFALCRYAE